MNFASTTRLVLRGLLARKGRSLLTMLGIMIGVAGVIVIIALGAGAQSLVLGQVTRLGSNLLSVQPGKSDESGPPAQLFGIEVTTLNERDAAAIRNRVAHAEAVSPIILGTASISWQNRTSDTGLAGIDSGYGGVFDFSMRSGRYFAPQEVNGGANVVILGSTVADQVFGGTGVDPIGQVVKAKSASQSEPGGVPLRVIGVFNDRGRAFFQDLDDQVFMPLDIAQKQLLGINHLSAINIKVDKPENIDRTIAEVKAVMMQQHHIRDEADADFTVRNQAQAVQILSTITDALGLFLTAMAAVSLVVGGIGILNIMLVTVAERTREIGLRKAVGATRRSVLTQFLYESSIMTLLGGVIGIIFGVVLAWLAAVLMRYLEYDWAFVISPISIFMAVGVSVLTGVIFGIYPALKASRLDPIEALRYE